ncbi:MAG: type IX secretion system outer membrane channel protein PorV [Bacteroidetes bacterium]|nr:type IX secretion system outer membrane channel protein PorV [Bacteroidota bacterium]
MNSKLRIRCLSALSLLALAASYQEAKAQFDPTALSKNGVRINTVTTAVPFLRINPDARAGGMGDVGVATPADVNSLFLNPANMAFNERDFGFSVSFTPWLKALVNDIYMGGLTGYYKVKEKQTVQIGLKYFSLGNITFTDYNGAEIGNFRPQEFSLDAGYARKLSNDFSIAATIRFIYSNLSNVGVDGIATFPGYAGAADISWMYYKQFGKGKMKHDLRVGMNISNIGNKITYTRNAQNADYIPTNLGIGLGYTLNIDQKNAVGLYMDISRLLVPSPQPATIPYELGGDTINPNYDKNGVPGADWRQKSPITGIFTSFGDAPGFLYMDANGKVQRVKGSKSKEELQETTFAIGAEYMYNKQFGVRFGYFYEPRNKGNRQFVTAGLTVKYSIVGLNFSYLIPTGIQRNPLDNTLRFSLLFDFFKGGNKAKANSASPSGVSLVEPAPKKKEKKVKEDAPAPESEISEPPKEMKLAPIEPK